MKGECQIQFLILSLSKDEPDNPEADAPSGIEHDDGTGDFAALEFGERFVDFRQLDAPGDHLVELELAGEIEVHEPRHIHRKTIRTHRRTLDAALAEESKAVELDLG